jgi:hypothetical protein
LDRSEDEIFVPTDSYLPDFAGRWMGIKIHKVLEAVTKTIAEKYSTYHQKQLAEVFLIFHPNIDTC